MSITWLPASDAELSLLIVSYCQTVTVLLSIVDCLEITDVALMIRRQTEVINISVDRLR